MKAKLMEVLIRLWWLYIFIGGMAVGAMLVSSYYQREAVKHEVAIHNAKTGAWEWIENKKKSTEDKVQEAAKIPSLPREEQKKIDEDCKKMGSKIKSDPECLLMGR